MMLSVSPGLKDVQTDMRRSQETPDCFVIFMKISYDLVAVALINLLL